jgi:hypothetical protein
MVGAPLHMSPEQAEMNGLDVEVVSLPWLIRLRLCGACRARNVEPGPALKCACEDRTAANVS